MGVTKNHAVIKLTPIVDEVQGECPGCGFDSLRRVRLYHLTSNGVGSLGDQTYCGRCINDMREHL